MHRIANIVLWCVWTGQSCNLVVGEGDSPPLAPAARTGAVGGGWQLTCLSVARQPRRLPVASHVQRAAALARGRKGTTHRSEGCRSFREFGGLAKSDDLVFYYPKDSIMSEQNSNKLLGKCLSAGTSCFSGIFNYLHPEILQSESSLHSKKNWNLEYNLIY